MGDFIVGSLAVIGALTVTGFALMAAIIALKNRSRNQATVHALTAHRQQADRLPVADALEHILTRTRRSRRCP